MLSKFLIGAAASLAALAALPGVAQADHRDRSYDGYYGKDDGYRRYRPGDYYGARSYRGGYDRYGYDRRYDRYGSDRDYDDYGYRDGRRYRRCGSGATGAVIGGAAGALVGREVGRSGRSRYRWHGRRGGGTGAIIGGAVGALVGREIARSC